MFFPEGHIRVYLYGQPVDMRKSYDGQSALARQGLQQDPLNGQLFAFINRRATQIKVPYFDRGGWCLLDPLEEQLNLPAILVDGGNRAGAQAVVVGQEHQDFAGIFAHGFDTAQQMRTLLLCSHTGEPDGLILEDSAVLGRLSLLDHFKLGVVLHARNEGHLGIGPFGEQPIGVYQPMPWNGPASQSV